MTWRGRLVWDATSAVNSAATFCTVHVNHRTPVGRTPGPLLHYHRFLSSRAWHNRYAGLLTGALPAACSIFVPFLRHRQDLVYSKLCLRTTTRKILNSRACSDSLDQLWRLNATESHYTKTFLHSGEASGSCHTRGGQGRLQK
jgi:hypothetical protein